MRSHEAEPQARCNDGCEHGTATSPALLTRYNVFDVDRFVQRLCPKLMAPVYDVWLKMQQGEKSIIRMFDCDVAGLCLVSFFQHKEMVFSSFHSMGAVVF